MLQNAKGPQDVDKLMKDFAGDVRDRAERTASRSSEMMPQLQRIMAHDISAQDAAKMFNVVAPARGRGEEGTSVEAAMKAIQKMKNEGTGEEFGVKRGMSDMEAVQAFSENITERKKNMMAEGDRPTRRRWTNSRQCWPRRRSSPTTARPAAWFAASPGRASRTKASRSTKRSTRQSPRTSRKPRSKNTGRATRAKRDADRDPTRRSPGSNAARNAAGRPG